MCRISFSIFLAGAAIFCAWSDAAKAWSHDEFRSGMTDADASELLRRKGYGDLIRAPIGEREGEYVLQSRAQNNKYHVTLCRGLVVGISVDIGTDFRLFATRVQVEKTVRGAPAVDVIQSGLYSIIKSTWIVENTELEYAFECVLGDTACRVALSYSGPSPCVKSK